MFSNLVVLTLTPGWVLGNADVNMMFFINVSQFLNLGDTSIVLFNAMGTLHLLDPVLTLEVKVLSSSGSISSIEIFEVFGRLKEGVVRVVSGWWFESFKNLVVHWSMSWGNFSSSGYGAANNR